MRMHHMRRTALLIAAASFVAEAGAESLYSDLYEPRFLAVDAVIGMEVVTSRGEALGRIREVLFDRDTGKVESIALDRAGAVFSAASLVSTDHDGRVIAEPMFGAASAGATTLVESPARALSPASGLVIDLHDGRVRPAR